MQVLGIVLVTLVLAVVATVVVLRVYIFPTEFRPVTLSEKEQVVLDEKLQRFSALAPGSAEPLEPEAYSEEGASREIRLTEKELNAMLANNTELASRVAIDLSDSLASAKVLVPVDPDFPMFGGKTLRVNAGLTLAYESGQPVIAIRGVSIMGVPVPNAWLGNLKNVNLVEQFGGQPGFWRSFADGVEQIRVEDGRLLVELKE